MTKRPPASAPDRAAQPRRRRAKRDLSADERKLWDAVAKSVRRGFGAAKNPPLEAGSPSVDAKTETPRKQKAAEDRRHPPPPKPQPAAARTVRPTGGAGEKPIRVTPAGGAIDPLGPRTPGLDRRTAKRLSRGESAPEARIDLHGMTAERAHGALISFIRSQHAAGARCVLVITGKGGRRTDDLNGWRPERVGVLRTMAPEWLRQAPIAGLVTGVYQAHRRHGGEGALYVYLRKRSR